MAGKIEDFGDFRELFEINNRFKKVLLKSNHQCKGAVVKTAFKETSHA